MFSGISRMFTIVWAWLAYPFLFSLLWVKSKLNWLQSLSKTPTVYFEKPYDSQKLVLLALFQKGALRADTERMLRTFQEKGYYVLVVNTLKLNDPGALESLCSCYVERYNFGRDFGSYKYGFEFIFDRGWDKTCPRLLLMNDSVYCASDRSSAFFDEMMNSEIDVLGSTENHEIIHHLGSFCIALSGAVLRKQVFHKFWRTYRNSDVRPQVIKRGEQYLSKCLKKAASSPDHFQTLYDSNRFLVAARKNEDILNAAMQVAGTSTKIGWQRFSAREVVSQLHETYLIEPTDLMKLEVKVELAEKFLDSNVFVESLDDLVELCELSLVDGGKVSFDVVRNLAIAALTEAFISGSQIHQNAALLLRMGLPIVKLDGLYRGAFSLRDMQWITENMTQQDAQELQRILLVRPYGGQTLRGWKRAAFMRGLI